MTTEERAYLLPEELEPEDDICIRVYVPNEQEYISALFGSLAYLGKWLAWERDPKDAAVKRGAIAAARWRQATERTETEWECAKGDCGIMDVRQATEPCKLEKQDGCDGSWSEFANLALCAPKLRIRNGLIEQETSPGVWEVVSPDGQPFEDRLDGPVTPVWTTVPEGETGNCLAAANVSSIINITAYELANELAGAYEFAGLVAIIVGYLGGAATGIIGLISIFLLEVAAWIVGSWNDIRDYDTTEALQEILNCLFDEQGVISQDNWNVALAQIDTEYAACGTDACRRRWTLVRALLNIVGPVGASRLAGASGIVTSECDACPFDWQHVFDFTVNDGGFYAADYFGTTIGVYEAGIGWHGVWSGDDAWRYMLWSPLVATSTIKAISLEWDYDDAERDYGNWAAGAFLDGSGAGGFIAQPGVYSPPPVYEGTAYGENTATANQVRVNGGNTKLPRGTHVNGDVGGVIVKKVIVWGNGSDPF